MLSAIKVKICCIQSIDEAEMAVKSGASALGLVSHMPSGPGVIPETQIRSIAAQIPPAVMSVLLTSRQTAAGIISQHKWCRTNAVQLVDSISIEELKQLREQLPGISLIQVIHVTDESALERARKLAPRIDALLLDSGNPGASVKELGGTGRTHNWEISAEIVRRLSIPVFLAGGLNPGNIRSAVRHVNPYGVDVCSGLRRKGHLDRQLLKDFMDQLHLV